VLEVCMLRNKNLNACGWQMHTWCIHVHVTYIYISCAPIILRGGKGYPRTLGAGRYGHSPTDWLHIYLWYSICIYWLMAWELARFDTDIEMMHFCICGLLAWEPTRFDIDIEMIHFCICWLMAWEHARFDTDIEILCTFA